MFREVWGEITYPFPNYNSGTVDVWKWFCNFIPLFMMDVLTYPCWDCLLLLTHCGLVMPYGYIEMGQLWLRWCLVAWQHQGIIWTDVELSFKWGSVALCNDQFYCNWWRYQFVKRVWKMHEMKRLPHLSGISDLTHRGRVMHICIIELGHHWFR